MTFADTVGCVVSTHRTKGLRGQRGAWKPRTLRLVLALCIPAVFALAPEAAAAASASASKTRELCATHTALSPAFRKAATRLGWRKARESETKAIRAVVADGAMVTIPNRPKRKIRWKAQWAEASVMADEIARGALKSRKGAVVLVTGKKPLSVLVVYEHTSSRPGFLHCLYTGVLDPKFTEFIDTVSKMDARVGKKRNWPYQLVKSNAKNVNPKRPAVVDMQAARYLGTIEAELGRKPWAQGGFSQVSYAHE